jgi:hypothetical protein
MALYRITDGASADNSGTGFKKQGIVQSKGDALEVSFTVS